MRSFLLAALLATGCVEQNTDTPVQAPPRQVELSPPKVDTAAESKSIATVIDDWHAAAAAADERRYFDHFADHAVFLGTDATERWDLEAFRKAVHPYFEKGKAWKYRSVRRAITVSPEGKRAWFDEDLETEKLGPARGSGVLVKEGGRWKIAQYDLSIPIPNARFAEVRALLSAAPRIELREQYKNVYKAATTSAKDDPAQAIKLLADLVPEAKTRPDDDLEFWLHNELTWLRWAQGDLDGALAEVEAAKATLDHSTIPEDKRAGLRLHELWDRAYLLLDAAMTKKLQVAERARTLQAAAAARDAYDALAKAQKDDNGMAVLAAFFALRQGKNADALAAAKKVDLAKDDDVQDLYVLRLAYDANKDKEAENVVKKICGSKDYLMKPLILRQAAKENWKCP